MTSTSGSEPKKRICVGLLAHVDAGKTTFAEQLLFQSGAIRQAGRVDHQNTLLDDHDVEKARGITVFLGQAEFDFAGNHYCLLDTPGHHDFAAEMERSIAVLDMAVVIVSAADGVQGHTETVWQLLQEAGVPTLVFLNKLDRDTAELGALLAEMRDRLDRRIVFFGNAAGEGVFAEDGGEPSGWISEEERERIAGENERLMELYLSGGDVAAGLREEVMAGRCFPCVGGSALNGQGIGQMLALFHWLAEGVGNRAEEDMREPGLGLQAYRVHYGEDGKRLVFCKLQKGTLRVKDGLLGEKVDQIRIYQGSRYRTVDQVEEGDLAALVGVDSLRAGMRVAGGRVVEQLSYRLIPLLRSRVFFPDAVGSKRVLEVFARLGEEDPMLHAEWQESLGELHLSVMGTIQLEVLQGEIPERFGFQVEFGECEVQYLETIASRVMGYGHFEPLRHYAEAHVRLEPLPRGFGMAWANECRNDDLKPNYQSLICQHIRERQHKGVLTGSPLTDVRIVAVTGRAHVKHTEGGDFREATYRAVRQGLRKAESVLLEPFYHFRIRVENALAGRISSDVKRMSGEVERMAAEGAETVLFGVCPVATMMNYQKELLAFTKGKGSMRLEFSGYDTCHNADEVIARIGYDPDRDPENPCGSVFCSHGSGFLVPWDEAEGHMHAPL